MAADRVPRSRAEILSEVLDSPEIQGLIQELEATRWTGRPGYPIRTMVGVMLAKSLYSIPVWTRTIALIREHRSLREILGCVEDGAVPSIHACYRFSKKLQTFEVLLTSCTERVLAALKDLNPKLGEEVAIDGSSLPAYANGHRYKFRDGHQVKRQADEYSDPDASWGHRSAVSTHSGGSFYGYKLHAVVDTASDLPLAWTLTTGRAHDAAQLEDLLDMTENRGFSIKTAAMDKLYDMGPVYEQCKARKIIPIIPLRQSPNVKKGENKPPTCKHGVWKWGGSDYRTRKSKWLCPKATCHPKAIWRAESRLHCLIPREGKKWRKLYKDRGAVEREFGRLKTEWGLLPLRQRGLKKVALHANLTILTQLTCALMKARTASTHALG